MPLRIYDISKKLGIQNSEVLAKAKELGITAAKVPSSSLDKITAEYLETQLTGVPVPERRKGLRGVQLGNFKAFSDAQFVPIRPLTLIFGANSSGKSSIIHGLLLAREAVDSGKLDVFKTRVGGDAVDLGGFRQYVHRRELTRRVEWSAELKTENLHGNAFAVLGAARRVIIRLFIGMQLNDKGMMERNCAPQLTGYEIEADGRVLVRLSQRKAGTMQVDRLDLEAFRPFARALLLSVATTQSMAPDDEAAISKAIENIIPEMRLECERLLPERMVGHDYASSAMPQLLAISKDNRADELAGAARLLIPRAIAEVIGGVNAALRSQMERVTYLGPLRSFPPRHLAFIDDSGHNWFAGGGYAWDLVRRDEKLREKINTWLGSRERLKTTYRLVVERLFTASDVQTSLDQGFGALTPDIVGRIIGEAQAAKTDAGSLLAARSEIEEERAEIQRALTDATERHTKAGGSLGKVEAAFAAALSKLEKTQMQRNVLVHGMEIDPHRAEKMEQLTKDLEAAQKHVDSLKDVREMVTGLQQTAIEEEGTLTNKLNELDRKKAEIFSEFQANLDEQELAKRLYDAIQARSDRSAVDDLILIDCGTETPVTHRDVGIGVSQVLPVLVHAYADEGRIVAIEQPEIHLHPALQAELGDLFIESALGERKNTFLLETHSEHLILRILRRVRETTEKKLPAGMPPVNPEDVAVLFVEPGPNGSRVKHLPVTPDGDFSEPWPGGFFGERFKDLP